MLDVATGTGTLALHLASAAGHIDAVDVAPGMLAQARRKAAAAGATNIDFREASAYELPFATERFDAVLCANALHIMDQPMRALAEIRRVCKPNARLVAPTFCHGQTVSARLLSRLLRLYGLRAYSRYTGATLCEEVQRAGFVIVSCEILPGLFPLAYLVARASGTAQG